MLALYVLLVKRKGLVSNVNEVWRHASTWALTLAGSIPTVYLTMYDKLKDSLPADWMAVITAVVAIAGLMGKTIKQDSTNGREPSS